MPEENILVVTHEFFMRVFIAYVVFDNEITAKKCQKFINKFHLENTGVTIVEYDKNNNKSPWHIHTWNDHSHLLQ